MIEAQVTKYLSSTLETPVYMGEEPRDKPRRYVVLQVIDSGRINFIDAVTFNIVSYAETLQMAAELNSEVKTAMYGIASLGNISSSKYGGGGQAINTSTKQHAYECVFNLFYTED